jgi:hypothetical protein
VLPTIGNPPYVHARDYTSLRTHPQISRHGGAAGSSFKRHVAIAASAHLQNHILGLKHSETISVHLGVVLIHHSVGLAVWEVPEAVAVQVQITRIGNILESAHATL